MKRIGTLTYVTYYLLILAVVMIGAHWLRGLLNLASYGEKFLSYLPFIPLFWETRLFRNSRNLPVKFRKFSSGKITVYLLNMDRATARLAKVMPMISRLGFQWERISAIDGDLLSKEYIKSIADLESYKKYFRMLPEVGTIGCSLSHEKAWRKFLESNNEFAIIFEDDAYFDPQELLEIIQPLIKKKELWDIVGLELNHHGHPIKITPLVNGRFLVAYLSNVKHAGCYLINRFAAHKLLEKFYPIKMPVDHYYTASWEFNFKFAGVEPRIVRQKFKYSQIKTSQNVRVTSLAVFMANIIYNAKRALLQTICSFYYFLLTCDTISSIVGNCNGKK
ncbi:MAG: glycosyltransferase family 25 protein [Holosporaceae bacterium]|jgi:glycosyl transferase family 25|nr:glycosyltransferase family 25 protein [Holosporaceae bacterium]